jgi:hypothetical protein
MKTLTSRPYIPALTLLALACLPTAASADTFTLDGAPIVSLSFGTVVTVSGTTAKTFTVEMATTDAAPYFTDIMLGTKIDLLTLDEFITVDGTTTENVLDFADDVVEKYQYTPGTDMLSSDVTFTYEKLTIMDDVGGSGGSGGNGNGNGNSGSGNGNSGSGNGVPEPSSAALLASGLLGLIGLSRKRHATARGGGRPVCCHP